MAADQIAVLRDLSEKAKLSAADAASRGAIPGWQVVARFHQRMAEDFARRADQLAQADRS
ncbi:hypothetical protein P3W33_11820 [Luteibacter sp. PPL552]